jgi:hypothetical protein
MSNQDILAALKSAPGSIATEIGSTPNEMKLLAEQGLVQAVGLRKTGKRGRPPVEWAIVGANTPASAAPVSNVPKLPEISDALRAALNESETNVVTYIEKVFKGEFVGTKYGGHEMADYRLLMDEYGQVTRRVARQKGIVS